MFIAVYLIVAHYCGDYLFQTREMANHKHESNKALMDHILAYGLVLAVMTIPLAFLYIGDQAWYVFPWLLVNMILHFFTDYITSRKVKQYWLSGREWETFAVMGLDQVLHLSTLIITFNLFPWL